MKIVKQGQSFLDKVTQLTGNYENALEMAFLNGVSITASSQDESLAIGTSIQVSSITNKRVVAFFNPKNEPATAVAVDNNMTPIGIGTMIIGDNFSVG